MRGCFQTFYLRYEIDTLEEFLPIKIYIPLAKIVSIQEYNNYNQHLSCGEALANPIDTYSNGEDYQFAYYWFLFTILGEKGCTCEMKDSIEKFITGDKIADTAKTECVCDLGIFPLYEVTVKGGKTYLLHPNSIPAIRRYIEGNDPMEDLVSELRFNPDIGIGREKRKAQEHFESAKHYKLEI